LVSSQFSKLLVSRRHVRSKKPPRPVGLRPGGEPKRGPSVHPSPFFNSSVQHACFRSINIMLQNAIHRRLHCVVFSPVHLQRCKDAGASPDPIIALIAVRENILPCLTVACHLVVSCVVTDQSLMSKNMCYNRRDELAATADAAAASAHPPRPTATTTTSTHVTPDEQSLASAQVGPRDVTRYLVN